VRVCLMNDNYYRSSGAAIAIKRIANAAASVEFRFAGCENEGLQEDLSWMPEGTYQRFALKTSQILLVIRELMRFKRWLKANACDLVHCHHRRIAVLLRLAGIPVVYTAQLAFPYSAWFRWLHPRIMTAITPSVAANLVETTGATPVACIGNPTSFPPFAPAVDLETVKHRAVCVARLDPVKAHVHLLSAWKILVDRGYRYELHLVGEGPMRSVLEAQAVNDGIQHLVHFRGFTPDPSEIVRESLFAVLVSQIEGQGIVTLEAAAAGRPSLLTAVPGSIDLIPPDSTLTNGIAFGDVENLAKALEEWFSAPHRVVAEGQRFFDFLRESSAPERIAREYVRVYQSVLRGQTIPITTQTDLGAL
jgi:glycosyltransferase involved in cell wall biosynthesis